MFVNFCKIKLVEVMPEAIPTTYFENLLIQTSSEEAGLGNI